MDLKCYTSADIKIILIGNNCHLEDSRTITKEEAEIFKNEYVLDLFIEVSSLIGNTNEIFIEAAKLLYYEYKKYKKYKNEKDIIYNKTEEKSTKIAQKKKCLLM